MKHDEVRDFLEDEFHPLFLSAESIVSGSRRIQDIVQGLRAFSRLGESEQKTVRIVEGLEQTIAYLQKHYEDIEFHCDWDDDVRLNCWPAELNQAFLNIITNGCQAIQARHEKDKDAPKGEIRVRTSLQDKILTISFSDNGIGMTDDVKDHIFVPFYTTREVGEGTGLGLSIAFSTVEKHQGSITVESAPQQGATFTISLPVKRSSKTPDDSTS